MPKLFVRQTALSNIGGRIDYISNPDRQENLLAVHDGADDAFWRQLAQECKLASKHSVPGTKCVQGRELIIQLSNSLLQRLEPGDVAKLLSERFEERYNRPCIVALHLNEKRNNLHAHLIYSERERLSEPKEKIAPRALFFDEHGKRQYKKSTVLDENGKLRPRCKIVEKGEVYERRLFGPVDPQFSSKSWLKELKSEWLLPLRNGELRGDVEITEYDPSTGELPQQHIGTRVFKAAPEIAAKIEDYNEDIKTYNQLVENGVISHPAALMVQKKERRTKKGKGITLKKMLQSLLEFLNKGRNQLPAPGTEERKSKLDDQIAGADKRKQISSARSEPEQER